MEYKYRLPKQLVEGYVQEGCKKVDMSFKRMVLLGILAGMFIAFGACSSSVAAFGIKTVSISKMAAGLVFPIGLMLIFFIGGELFTGDCLMIIGRLHGKFKTSTMLQKLVIVFFSNLIGALTIVVLAAFSGQFKLGNFALGAYTIKVAYTKATMSFLEAFTSGILCNIIVCLACLMAFAAKDMVSKIFAIFFPIFAFVVSGFEHCVANMYYIPAGILASVTPDYKNLAMETYELSVGQIEELTIGNMILHNLIPVTLGNIVGGMLFVGVPLYMLHGERKNKNKNIVLAVTKGENVAKKNLA